MKVVILAAGIGTRLGNGQGPKTLTQLPNGKSILELQLDNIRTYTSLDNVFIVVGYQKKMIIEQFPNIKTIFNADFAQENTSKSLLKALDKVDDDLLWINGDVIFKKSILNSLLLMKTSSMVVNEGVVGEEEVKYRADQKGKIVEVSKQVVEAQGEALGINFFLRKDLALLKENLEKCAKKDYFEKAIELSIEQGLTVHRVVIAKDDCIEIDFPEDLEKAKRMTNLWEQP